jgi:hypothetical protein
MDGNSNKGTATSSDEYKFTCFLSVDLPSQYGAFWKGPLGFSGWRPRILLEPSFLGGSKQVASKRQLGTGHM